MRDDNPVRRLVLVEDAVRNVYELYCKSGDFAQLDPDCPPEDKLGLTLCLLRAYGRSNWPLIQRCVHAYLELSKWTGTGYTYSIPNSNMNTFGIMLWSYPGKKSRLTFST